MVIKENESLAQYTTIKLGGQAKYFAQCDSVDDIKEALQFAHDKKIRVHVIGGGSNTLFSDNGFNGLVLRVVLSGIEFKDNGDAVLVTACAGELWDDVVSECVERCLAGIECMSGIPGLVGALPVQNVGAYAQQVADTIVSVQALDMSTGEIKSFSKEECEFGYRTSRFKTTDSGRYIITAVTFSLQPNGEPHIEYPDIVKEMAEHGEAKDVCDRLLKTRQAVLAIRGRKSMLIKPGDENTKSCGSFFTNVVLSAFELDALRDQYAKQGGTDQIPVFESGDKLKVPAAWLIEHSGFKKGERRGGVGISEHHVLALVNHTGTTKELMAFAAEVQAGVKEKFGIELALEPIVVE